MKRIKFISVFLLFFGLILNSSSQSVDEIINKHIEAIGGMDSLNAIKTMKLTGKFGGSGFEAPSTIMYKRPAMVKMEMEFQGNSMITAYDGTTAWQINPWGGKKTPEKMPAERTKDMKEMADFDGSLVNYKLKGFTAELIGKEDMEGTEVYKIKLTDKDNDVTYYFLDTQTFLLLKESSKRKIKEKEIEAEKFYANYQKYGGVMMALSVEFRGKGETTGQTGTIDKVEMNIEVDDAIFKMPEGK